jgi:glycosyltransferase involved in cell wall biosynthesis
VPSFAISYQVRPDECASSGSPTVVYVGALTSHKLGVLLRAFELLSAEKHSHLRLAIAGAGPQDSEVARAADRDSRIDYLGALDGQARDKLLSEAAVLVIPSTCPEVSPLVFFEALATGLPVVASAIGGITELQRFGNVLLVPPGDALALKEALETLLLDEAQLARLRMAARQHRSYASPARYAAEIAGVLERLTSA